MSLPIQSPNLLAEWSDAIDNVQLENVKLLLNIDPELLWTPLPYTLDHDNDLYIELIHSLRLGVSVQPLSALQYCIIHYHQLEKPKETYDIISYLIEEASVDDLNTCYWGDCHNSTLHLVCFMGQLDILDLLLKKGVSLSVKNNLGFLPDHVASNQAILDGLSFYKQKRKQQERISGATSWKKREEDNRAISNKLKILRDLADGSTSLDDKGEKMKKNKPEAQMHYYVRKGYVKEEAQKVLTKDEVAEIERQRAQRQMEVNQLAKKSAVKNNPIFKQFERNNYNNESEHRHPSQLQELPPPSPMTSKRRGRRLSFGQVIKAQEPRSKRDSMIMSSLKKSNLVSSSAFRQRLNENGAMDFSEETIITELYSGRPSTILEHQSEEEQEEEEEEEKRGEEEEEEPKEVYDTTPDMINNLAIGEEEYISNLQQASNQFQQQLSTTESILTEYAPDDISKTCSSIDDDISKKVLRETEIIENEIDLMLAETAFSHGDMYSDNEESLLNDYYPDGLRYSISSENKYPDMDIHESSFVMDGDNLKENMYTQHNTHGNEPGTVIETAKEEEEEEEEEEKTNHVSISDSNASSWSLFSSSCPPSLSTPTFGTGRELDNNDESKKISADQKVIWTQELNTQSSITNDEMNTCYLKLETSSYEKKIPESNFAKQQEKSESESESELYQKEWLDEPNDLLNIRRSLDMTDEDIKLMLHQGSIRKSIDKGIISLSSTPRSSIDNHSNSGLLSVDEVLSNTSSARSSSSINTLDGISCFYHSSPDPFFSTATQLPLPLSTTSHDHDHHHQAKQTNPEKLNYSPAFEKNKGKLHVHVRGVQDIKIPIPKEPTLVCCVVSDGQFEYASDYQVLAKDIEFDHKCTVDVFPGMSITVSLHVHPDYVKTTPSTTSSSSIMQLVHRRKDRHSFSSYISKEDGVIGLAYWDIPSCLRHDEYYRATIYCFNSWHSKSFLEKYRRNSLNEEVLKIAGKFDMDMFYSPVT